MHFFGPTFGVVHLQKNENNALYNRNLDKEKRGNHTFGPLIVKRYAI